LNGLLSNFPLPCFLQLGGSIGAIGAIAMIAGAPEDGCHLPL
jgi:hypothetical protein